MKRIVSVSSLRWNDASRTSFDCQVTTEDGKTFPFTCSPNDPEEHGRDLWQRAMAGEFGSIASEAAATVTVPRVVTMRQARLALLQTGHLANVEAAISSMASPQKEAARIEWEYSQTVERDRQLVSMLAPALGLNAGQIDQLFVLAASL